MCGIVGYIGKKTNIQKVLIKSLKKLEYRGYDSAGIAYVNNNKIDIIKEKGKIEKLEKKIDYDIMGNLGIAHTRWATHGKANENNAHPHRTGMVTIVHNGIIENYLEIKRYLEKKGYSFKTETDSEIACALLDYIKTSTKMSNLEVIKEFTNNVMGSYALGIIFDDDLDTLYATRKDSPLLIGYSENVKMIVSDISALNRDIKNYYLLENGDIVKLTERKVSIYDNDLHPVSRKKLDVKVDGNEVDKNGFEHFMLKEIHEESVVLDSLLKKHFSNSKTFLKKMPELSKYSRIHIVGCGSAMHVGLVGKYLFEEYANIETDVEVASEYRYKKVFYDAKTLVILVSQSGETADTIACLRKAKEDGIDTLAIVNVPTSTMAREADFVLNIEAGTEVAVATTKAYLLQVAILILINLKMMVERKIISIDELDKYLQLFSEIPKKINEVIDLDKEYFKIAQNLYHEDNIFYIGRGIDYAISMEGSLKLKEISYIHSESYKGGELKHGTISLIEKNTKVIAVMTDRDLKSKTISNIKEIKARGADIILITTKQLDDDYDFVSKKIVLPKTNSLFTPILSIIPLQLIAYYVAKLRGCDIDKPRNLAKSVTVE